MKLELLKNFKFLRLVPFLITIVVFASCQQEEVEITDTNTEEAFDNSSTVAQSIFRTTSYDGSYDNILDSANCFSINLPVTIQVNGISLTINSVDDFDVLEDILEELDTDDDDIVFTYPITITLTNYNQITINNDNELAAFIDDCFGENEEDDDIECIDFQYPITISIFNANFDIIGTEVINSDEELYNFIDDLDGGVLASINFPITMILADGSTIQINTNQELETAINQAEDTCDEDDDYDYDDDDCTGENIELALKECFWEITSYNNLDAFNDYYLDFDPNYGFTVTVNGNIVHDGTWSVNESQGDLVISFNTNWGDLVGDWILDGCYGDDEYNLVNGNVTMQIEQDCDYNNNIVDCTETQVDTFLDTCIWNVVNYNGSNDLIAYNLDFNSNGSVNISGDGLSITGNWSTSTSNSGNLQVEFLNVSGPNIQAISGNWTLVDCDEDRLEFIDSNGNTMVLEQQNCYIEDELFDVASLCQWEVSSFIANGIDETANYNGVIYSFYENGFALAENGDVLGYGSIEADNTTSGQLIVLLQYYNTSASLGNYYIVSNISDNELIFTGAGVDTELIFTKNCSTTNQDSDTTEIKNWLYNGDWEITYSTISNQDNTTDYDGIVFDFQDGATFTADNGSFVANLEYEILRDINGNLRFVINYLGQFPYWQMDDDWYITEVDQNRIELHHVNDDTNNEFVLVFEKL